MLRVVVASKNPVKGEAIRQAFVDAFPGCGVEIVPVAVASGVREQPLSSEETLQGARNRAKAAAAATMMVNAETEYIAAVEGGVEEQPPPGGSGRWVGFAWVVVARRGSSSGGGTCYSAARSATFPLPTELAEQTVREGGELGPACDRLFCVHNTKEGQGAIGLLTSGSIPRTELYRPALRMALIPFTPSNAHLHFDLPCL
jgi:inosine/xanthosine triphosphatase